MPVAAVYLRQSVDRELDQHGVTRQREDCLKLCAARGWEVLEYVENDTSATSGNRPRYKAMLEDIRAGKVQAVVAWHLDRLHRQPIELEHFMVLADEKKIALATVTGDVDLSTDQGQFVARIMGAVARQEIDRKSKRQKRAMRQKAESGEAWGARAFGFLDKERTALNEVEARAVREAYSAILAGGSLYSIVKDWNSREIRTSTGGTWNSRKVKEALMNPRYAGLRNYREEIVAKGKWPAIVSEDVWRGACDILTSPQRQRGRAQRKHLLSGLVRCGRCETELSSGVKRRTDGFVYVCKGCHKLSRAAEPIDKVVTGLALAYLKRPDAANVLLDRSRDDLRELREAERATEASMESLAADHYVEKLITRQQFLAANKGLEARLADIRSRMTDANRARAFDGLVGAEDVEKVWDGLSLERKRAVLAALFVITVKPVGRGQNRFSPEQLQVDWLTAED